MSVKRTFTGDQPLVYPHLSAVTEQPIEPGTEVEFDKADQVPDDGRWATEKDVKSDAKPEAKEK